MARLWIAAAIIPGTVIVSVAVGVTVAWAGVAFYDEVVVPMLADRFAREEKKVA